MKKCCSKKSKKVISGLLDDYNAVEKVILLSPEVTCCLINYTQIFTPYKLLIKTIDFVFIKVTKNCATEEQSSKSQKSLVDRGCK